MNSGSFNTSGYQGRYLLFTWALTSQNFDTNSSVISWTLAGAGDALSEWYESGSFKVVINGITVYASSARIQLYNGTIVANGDLTITHNGDGSKTFSASAEGAIGAVLVNSTGSGSWELPKISREATLTDAPNFTDEQNPTIEYINPSGSYASSLQACISLNEIDDLITWRDIPKNGTRYTFELTEIERNSLRASSITSNILPVTFILKTIIEGETYYSKISRNMVIVNADPVFSGATYEDVNPITLEITEDDQEIIEGLSSVSFTLSNLSALKSSVLSSISISINGVVVTAPVSGTTLLSKVVSFGVVDASDDLEAIVTLIDSRGNTGTISVPLSILSYSAPSAIISCNRDNNYETDTELVVNAAFSSLDSKNELTIEYQYKEIDGSTWSALTEISNNTPETISLDNTKAWSLRVILTDLISSTTYNLAVERGLPLVFYDRKRRSIGINCFPSADEVLEVNGVNVFINPDWTETDPTSPSYIRNKPSITQVQADWTESDPSDPAYIKNKPTLGTAAALDVPASGDASSSEVVLGSDTRLSDSRSVTFTEAQTRSNIESGEGLNTLFGKIKKFFTDLKAVAFSGSYTDLTDKPTIPDPNDYVRKTGDTITGVLYRHTSIDPSIAESGNKYNLIINTLDKNNNNLSKFSVSKLSNTRTISTYLSSNIYVGGGVTNTNSLDLRIDEQNNQTVEVSSPSAWRSALGLANVASSGDYNDLSNKPTIPAAQVQADWTETDTTDPSYIQNKPTIPVGSDYVLKTGDTMTGDLTMQAASIKEDFRNSAQNGELSVYYNEDKASYSTQSVPRDYVICTKDKNNWVGAYLYEQTSNQGCRTSIGARNYWSNGTLVQNMYFGVKVGTPYDTPAFEISHPKLLLDNSTSIGKLTSGSGTKTNNWTASGGVTCNWVRSGHVVTVEYSFTVTIASGSSIARWTNLFTGLPKAYSSSCWILGEGGSLLIINTNGQLQNVYQWNSGSVFYRGSCTYLTDDFS